MILETGSTYGETPDCSLPFVLLFRCGREVYFGRPAQFPFQKAVENFLLGTIFLMSDPAHPILKFVCHAPHHLR